MNAALSSDDIQDLCDLRDHLARLTEAHKRSAGWIYDDEVLLLDRVIDVLNDSL